MDELIKQQNLNSKTKVDQESQHLDLQEMETERHPKSLLTQKL